MRWAKKSEFRIQNAGGFVNQESEFSNHILNSEF
jgi:hypothetical protein